MGNINIEEQAAPIFVAVGDCWLGVIEDVKLQLSCGLERAKAKDELKGDMSDRRDLGIKKYGVPVQPFNGRNPLIDAYQELLDAAVYLKQHLEEQGDSKPLDFAKIMYNSILFNLLELKFIMMKE